MNVIWTPASYSQAALCLGTQASEEPIRDAVIRGAFAAFKRDDKTLLRLSLEGRP